MAVKNPYQLSNYKIFNHPILLVFLLLFVIVGALVVYYSLASGVPVVRDNVEYWRPRIAKCESGGRYNAVNSAGYYGAYQFDIGTWSKYGGYTRADQAPPEIQDAKFNETFARRGSQPWNSSYHCWSKGTAVVTPRPGVAFIPKLSTYNVAVTGKVVLNNAPAPNVPIDTCGNSSADFKTDASGTFAFILGSRKSFCVRVKQAPEGATPVGNNNNYEHKDSNSYEYQIAGVNVYHDLWSIFSPSYRWDRAVDSDYDFIFAK